MKLARSLVLAATCLIPLLAQSSETAQARIWCLSLHFQQGSDGFGDTLDLSSDPNTPNGELAPYNGLQYACYFTLTSSSLPISGTMYVNLPPPSDANNDGWSDFFEVSQATGGNTSGTYSTGISDGTVAASWSRGAGSKDGTCILHLMDNSFGDLGQFQHSFELIEYTGPLTYTPGSNIVNGSVNLIESGDPSSQLLGPVQFVKVASDRFNQLTVQAGTWTNAQLQSLGYSTNSFQRDQSSWPTNYYGLMTFADGDLTTPMADYLNWYLSIDDANDANGDGIPDFSDDPVVKQVKLVLSLTTTNLQLSIGGASGSTCQIQQSPILPATNWQSGQTITVTNDPQVVTVPLPASGPAFWRAQVQ
jgi:hypothetical protein